jgi:beta-lactamase superfamily II metal-dependent hydrolase
MAMTSTAKKAGSRAAAPAAKKRAAAKTTRGAAAAKSTGAPARGRSPQAAPAASSGDVTKLRVRMFRVGFGDFFLISVPTSDGGAKHILIDCGVHAKDLGSIKDAVAQMAQDCGSQLALVIMTHRHADHISGFATCRDVFGQITVERVWMSWFEDRTNQNAMAHQSSLAAVADGLSRGLAARGDADSELARMAGNITGAVPAAGAPSANQAALDVLHGGFKNKPNVDYYKAGDVPTLPQDLVDAGLSAQILGPPVDPSLVNQMTNQNEQYLSSVSPADAAPVIPFAAPFRAEAADYPASAFKVFTEKQIVRLVDSSQPDTLAAQAAAADNTLNNQSLVVLFTFGGKNLLFAGDAQWGNWENFLYGGAYGTPGHTELTAKAKAVLGQLDFYKVGHHGSANATPKDAVAAMRQGCVGMCSTQPGAYNEVPRGPLLQALGQTMRGQLARSDQVPVPKNPPSSDAGRLPSAFKAPTGALFIDYEF